MALNLKSSRKSTLIIGLAVAVIIVGLVMIYLQASNLNRLKAEIEDEKVALNLSEMRLSQRLDHQNKALNYQERYDRLKLMIPGSPEEEEILRNFTYLAEEYGLTISEIRFDGRLSDQGKDYIEMPLNIVIDGRYRDIVGMLDRLHSGNRAIRIDDIGISLLGRETAQIRVTLKARAFHLTGN